MFSDRIIFCNYVPLKIVKELKINLKSNSDYESEEVESIHRQIMSSHPDILKAI